MSPKLQYRKSCKPCRQRHLKCDQSKPKCTNCQKARYDVRCFYEPKEFRFRSCIVSSMTTSTGSDGNRDNDTNDDNQVDAVNPVSQNNRLDQVNNANEENEGSNNGNSSERDTQGQGNQSSIPQSATGDALIICNSPDVHSSSTPTEGDAFLGSDVPQEFPLPPLESQTNPISPAAAVEASGPPFNPDHPLNQASPAAAAFSGLQDVPPTPSSLCVRGLTDSTEAFIFGFYLETAGPWLDIVSPNRYFGIHVPMMMNGEHVLQSACLAYSSLVLHLHGQVTAQVKDELHERALRQLIPLITSYREGHGHVSDLGPIHATTVILRMTEQFLELGEDRQHHLHGSSTLFETAHHDWSLLDNSMSSTSFWAYLRGSIRVSFLLEQPCPFELRHLSVWRYASRDTTLPDEARTNLMTYLLAEVCTLCWGVPASEDSTSSKLAELGQAISEWKRCLPQSFQPWYLRYEDDGIFPDIRFLAPWHCVAWQFFYAAEVLLAVHSTTIQAEKNLFRLTRLLEEKIMAPTRWLCGVTLSTNHAGVKVNGSHLVAWCAQYITGKTEQSKILEMLVSLWQDIKWPNLTCHNRLRDLWNGSRESWVTASDGQPSC